MSEVPSNPQLTLANLSKNQFVFKPKHFDKKEFRENLKVQKIFQAPSEYRCLKMALTIVKRSTSFKKRKPNHLLHGRNLRR